MGFVINPAMQTLEFWRVSLQLMSNHFLQQPAIPGSYRIVSHRFDDTTLQWLGIVKTVIGVPTKI